MNLQENTSTKLKRRIHLLDRVINNMLPNMYPCDYNSSDHFVEGLLDEIRWFLIDFEELQGIERIDIENYILDHKYDELTNYFNERCIVLKKDYIQENIRRILRESVPPQVRRRIPTFDDAFIHYRDAFNNYTYGNFNVYWWNVMERVLETLYHAWFTNTVPDDEWEESEKYIKDYLTEKYYEDTKKWWSKHKNRHRLQESEGKKSSLLSKIEDDGLYEVISNTGLYINQIEQKVGQLSREVLVRFIIDMVKEHHIDTTMDGQTYVMDLDYVPFNPIPVDENDYVEQITTRNNELFFTVVHYEEDEYGDLDYSGHSVVSPKDLSYDNIYEIAGLLAFNLIKGRI